MSRRQRFLPPLKKRRKPARPTEPIEPTQYIARFYECCNTACGKHQKMNPRKFARGTSRCKHCGHKYLRRIDPANLNRADLGPAITYDVNGSWAQRIAAGTADPDVSIDPPFKPRNLP